LAPHGIDAGQVFALLLLMRTVPVLAWLPVLAEGSAGRDAWLAALLATAAAVPFGLLMLAAVRRLGPRTAVEGALEALGPWLGRAAVLPLLAYLPLQAAVVLRINVEGWVATSYPVTPRPVFVLSMAFLAALGARQGLETLGRVAQVLLPASVVAILVAALMVKDPEPSELLPVLERGLAPVLRASVEPLSLFGWFVVLLQFGREMAPGQGRKSGTALVAATAAAGVMLALTAATAVSVFGPVWAARLRFPTLALLNANPVPGLLVIVYAVWVGGTFLGVAVFLYAAAVGWQGWLGLTSYRWAVWPLAAASAVAALVPFATASDLMRFVFYAWPPAALAVQLGSACLALLAAWILGRRAGR
jgi:spore germination protein KB